MQPVVGTASSTPMGKKVLVGISRCAHKRRQDLQAIPEATQLESVLAAKPEWELGSMDKFSNALCPEDFDAQCAPFLAAMSHIQDIKNSIVKMPADVTSMHKDLLLFFNGDLLWFFLWPFGSWAGGWSVG